MNLIDRNISNIMYEMKKDLTHMSNSNVSRYFKTSVDLKLTFVLKMLSKISSVLQKWNQ